jgi:hypothetical protein
MINLEELYPQYKITYDEADKKPHRDPWEVFSEVVF